MVNKDAERLNPCLKEQELSYACLSKNGYDQSKCEAYFDNYNTCKKFWHHINIKRKIEGKVSRDRRAQGIHPFMPDVDERSKIKAEFAKFAKGET